MTIEELKGAFDTLQNEHGWTKENILATAYEMYQTDKIDLEQLRAMTELLGYEFTEEFENMSEEDKKTKGVE